MRSRSEIEDQIALADDAIGGSEFPGMTYEEGVSNALRWALGDTNDKPMDD